MIMIGTATFCALTSDRNVICVVQNEEELATVIEKLSTLHNDD